MFEHLNDIFITNRLAARLGEIERCEVTTVVAPMGYGKTTAIQYWQDRMSQEHPEAVILRQSVFTDSVSDLWRGFCRLLAKRNPTLAAHLREAGFPHDLRGCGLIADLWDEYHASDGAPVWCVLDDVHLLPSGALSTFLSFLPEGLEGFHMVLLSRNRILTRQEQLRLGRHLCEIRMSDLALTQSEMRAYAEHCGLPLVEGEAARMMQISEGWISLIYLFLRSRSQGGDWGFDAPNVFALIDQVMLEPLSERQRDFLLCCSAAEEFTLDQADFLWRALRGGDDAGELLTSLTENNAFITVNAEGVYRCHNMLLQSVRTRLSRRSEHERRELEACLGRWYHGQGEYLEAMRACRAAEDWEGLLRALVADRGNSLDGEQHDAIIDWCENCPDEMLRDHPEAILVLTLGCFSVGAFPEMLKMNDLLLEVTRQSTSLSEEERNNYLGESQLLLSFLQFNSITGMSAFQRRAGELMTRPTLCLDLNRPWTFGAPSVLSLYHRDCGALDAENKQMRDCMPWYERISDGHGRGAEHVFGGETCLMRGDIDGAAINYNRAVEAAEEKKQYSILAAAAFLAARIDLQNGDYARMKARVEKLRTELRKVGQLFLLTAADMCEAWCLALLGRPELAPEWVADSPAAALKGPAWPSFLTVRDQVRLAHGDFARLIASGERRKALFEEQHALLPAVYLHIHLAAACAGLDRRDEAGRELKTALALAAPDRLWLPFAENAPALEAVWDELPQGDEQPGQLRDLAERFLASRAAIVRQHFPARWDERLTERERDVAALAAQRLAYREIAARLLVSENTVKTHLRRAYEKLGITGTDRNKRTALERLAGQ